MLKLFFIFIVGNKSEEVIVCKFKYVEIVLPLPCHSQSTHF